MKAHHFRTATFLADCLFVFYVIVRFLWKKIHRKVYKVPEVPIGREMLEHAGEAGSGSTSIL